ncbi:MAG: hypothetical protein ACFFG0_36950 [Candidatus Thorarchaeota archaeon]
MIGIGSPKREGIGEIIQKYKNVGKHILIANKVKKNDFFLKFAGVLLYNNTKAKPVKLIVKVNVRIGLKLM